jgi:putative spermidine/putrescine transport system permease protein
MASAPQSTAATPASRRGGVRPIAKEGKEQRPLSFYLFAGFFVLFVMFLYGPLSAIMLLSFQGPEGGLTFPMNGVSTVWFVALFQQQRVGDFVGSFWRSFALGLIVMVLSVTIGTMVGLAYRYGFRGATVLFYLTVASLVVPSILISLGIGILFERLGLSTAWYTSGVGAHLTWTLPFALLIMLAVFNRFNPSYEEAARDLGANDAVAFRDVVLPLIAPSLVGVALLGFSLSYDEIARSSLTIGEKNTLPLEIYGMTTNVTSPSLYALGTVTTVFSFIVIALFLVVCGYLGRRQARALVAQAAAEEDQALVLADAVTTDAI